MRHKVELSAEEEDASSVVCEAAEAASISLDCLDLGVEALGEGVRDRMLEVGEEIDQVGLERLGHGFYLGQLAAHDGAVPLGEEAFAAGCVRLAPKLYHLLLVEPGPGGLQVHFQKLGKGGLVLLRHRSMEPQVAGLLER